MKLLEWEKSVQMRHEGMLCPCKKCVFCKALQGEIKPYVQHWRRTIGQCGCSKEITACIVCEAEKELGLVQPKAPTQSTEIPKVILPILPHTTPLGAGVKRCKHGHVRPTTGPCLICQQEWKRRHRNKHRNHEGKHLCRKGLHYLKPLKSYCEECHAQRPFCNAGLHPRNGNICRECKKITKRNWHTRGRITGLCVKGLHPWTGPRKCYECYPNKGSQKNE